MPFPVKFFDSTMQGAPQLSNTWGCMTALLDAVLVNGFNLKTVTGLTSVGGVATAAVVSGHLYRVGQILWMEGANQAEYNGEVKVLTATSTNFTYAITGTPVSPATTATALTVKVAPIGWEIAFTGTNKRAYRSIDTLSNKPYLRVDDSLDPLYNTAYAKFAKVTMAQGMSDIDTFVGARTPYDPTAPTRNEVATGSGATVINGWYRWYYAKASGNAADIVTVGEGNRAWTLIGDSRGFFLFNETGLGQGIGGRMFSDFTSYRASDAFNSMMVAQDYFNVSASISPSSVDSEGYLTPDQRARFPRQLDATGKVCMRSYLQVGNPVGLSFASLNVNNSTGPSGYGTGISWPNGPDYSLMLHPVYLREGTHMRGKLPGLFWILNDSPAMSHLDTITGVAGYPGRVFQLVKLVHGVASNNYTAMVAIDITGPWY